jgi:uncharacterized membrane protein YvbJ
MKCKNCGTNYEGKICPNCGKSAMSDTITTNALEIAKAKQRKGCAMVFAVIAGIILAIVVITVINSNQPKKELSQRELLIAASQMAVEKSLKSPSSAKFPPSDDKSYQIVQTKAKNVYNIEGYVDAQNSFGAAMRSRYIAKIEYFPDIEQYKALSVKIYDN